MSQYRGADNLSWRVHLSPVLQNFPTDNPLTDTQNINDLVEAAIRRAPEQYLWPHRRFKTHPTESTPSLYSR